MYTYANKQGSKTNYNVNAYANTTANLLFSGLIKSSSSLGDMITSFHNGYNYLRTSETVRPSLA